MAPPVGAIPNPFELFLERLHDGAERLMVGEVGLEPTTW